MSLDPAHLPAESPRVARWHAASVIWARDCRALLLSPGTASVTFMAALAAYLFLVNYGYAVGESGLTVLSSTFHLPVLAFVAIVALYLTLAAITSLAREYERGTLETLFYGPIDNIAFVAGKMAAYACAYLAALALGGLGYLLHALASRFAFPASTWAVIGLSVPVTLHLVAFGLCLTTLSRKLRAGLGWFLAIAAVFAGVQFGSELIALAPASNQYYNPLRFAQQALERTGLVLTWGSPFGLLTKGAEAARRGHGGQFLIVLGLSVFFAMAFAGISMRALLRRGVRA